MRELGHALRHAVPGRVQPLGSLFEGVRSPSTLSIHTEVVCKIRSGRE
jgi:hypothetical protein